MVQNKDSDDGRKGMVGERESRGVSLHDSNARTFLLVLFRQARYEAGIIFEAGDATGAAQQFFGGGAGTRAHFEHVIAEQVAGDDPREQLAFGDKTPQRGSAKPVFKAVHEQANPARCF